tara:strand:- start:93 stop:254 length:162 start_codon:yes stop_codon:yes gene_type:complete
MLISLTINIKQDVMNSAQKITYIGLKFIITTAIFLLIMVFLIIEFDLKVIFKK